MQVKRALISVSDKTKIVELAKNLTKLDVEIISTGGTAKKLKKAGVKTTKISDVTDFPEILNGRVKTLNPKIHGGILAQRKDKEHMDTLKKHKIQPIDLVVCNLYPFEKTIKKNNVKLDEVIENIDIGGPTLIRAAAKNYQDIIILTDPKQYDPVVQSLKKTGKLSLDKREKLAIKAFQMTAQYDAIISQYFQQIWTDEIFPEKNSLTMRLIKEMRYGENPHLRGAFYKQIPETKEPSITNAEKLHGKELSYNNILDGDCAIETIKEFQEPTCVIIKHVTPCGIASADTVLQSWKDAFSTDTYSPFGGIVSFNRKINKKLAEELSKIFLEVIIAPDYTTQALEKLQSKKNLRLLKLPGLQKEIERKGMIYRSVVGGFLTQDRDIKLKNRDEWKVVTQKKPTEEELTSMEFAVKCVKHVKSNSVLFVKDKQTVGIGGGQTARVDASWIATHKGKEDIKGSIMASDAFFPFRDGIDVAAKAGVKAIIQPGGSIRDKEVIKAADEHDISMVFTGQRYFRH
ncbi:MAG: bifunctional phosphoribosylaminoimidazolecarboxamide formyltransferase/IMP cyclohydrolase [Candidatus Thermoplasmatota archaeon]